MPNHDLIFLYRTALPFGRIKLTIFCGCISDMTGLILAPFLLQPFARFDFCTFSTSPSIGLSTCFADLVVS